MDADVSKLYISVSQHPVKCPVKREKDISHNNYCNRNCLMHAGLNLMRDAQVDGSLSESVF